MTLNNWNMVGALIAIIFINVNFRNKAGSPPTLAFNWYPYIRNGSIFNGLLFTLLIQGLLYEDRFDFFNKLFNQSLY